MKKRHLKAELFRKTSLYIFTLVIFISAITGVFYYNSSKTIFLRQNQRLLSVINEQASHFLRHPIEELTLVESKLAEQETNEIQELNIQLILERFDYIDRVDYLDRFGVVLASYPSMDDFIGLDFSNNPLYKSAQSIKPLSIIRGGVYIDPIIETPKMPITMKTRDGKYIIGYVNLAKLKTAFSEADLDGFIIAIVDNTGHYLFNSNDESVKQRQVDPNYLAIEDGSISSGDVINFKGTNKILQFQRFESNDWYFLVYQDLDTMINPIIVTLSIIIISFLLVTLLTSYAMRSVLEKLESSLLGFIKATKNVSEGRYQTQVEVYDYVEFQNLADNFNHMIDEVQIREEEINNLNNQLEESYLKTVYLLAKTIEAKDAYTGDHCERVKTYATLIGEKIGLSRGELYELKHGSLLHDIGKLNIPELVLTKPGRLTDEEYILIKNHSLYGHNLVKEIPNLNLAKEIVLYHHERVDGTGYPDGLKGNDIPLLARLVCIADAFDAMMSRRPYRSCCHTLDEAIKELKECSGTQFDTRLVNIFIDILEKNPELVGEHNE